MRNIKFECLVTAKQPISHGGGESKSNINLFRRQTHFKDSIEYRIPVISGNSVRGITRDLSAEKTFDDLSTPDEPFKAALSTIQTLFSGGALTDKKTQGDLDFEKNIREKCPHLSLLGASIGNTILEGKLNIFPLMPICEEIKHTIPERFWEGMARPHAYELTELFMNNRQEDSHKPSAAKFLDGEPSNSDTTAMMIYETEVMKAGTRLYWKIILRDPTDLEFVYFQEILSIFKHNAKIGGSGRIGWGEIEMSDWTWHETIKVENAFRSGNTTVDAIHESFNAEKRGEIKEFLKKL